MLNTRRAPYGNPPGRAPIEVEVRCVWQLDGERWERGVCLGWSQDYAFGQLTGDAEVEGAWWYVEVRDLRRPLPVDDGRREPA